jgi:DNA topoisomerase I
MLLDVDTKQKKKKGADYFKLDEELDQEWIKEWQAKLLEDEKVKITKAFNKANEKKEKDGEKPAPEKELKERLKAVDEMAAKFKRENKSGKVEAEGKSPTVASIEARIAKTEEKIRNDQVKAADREENKEVALGTSKIVSETTSAIY